MTQIETADAFQSDRILPAGVDKTEDATKTEKTQGRTSAMIASDDWRFSWALIVDMVL